MEIRCDAVLTVPSLPLISYDRLGQVLSSRDQGVIMSSFECDGVGLAHVRKERSWRVCGEQVSVRKLTVIGAAEKVKNVVLGLCWEG